MSLIYFSLVIGFFVFLWVEALPFLQALSSTPYRCSASGFAMMLNSELMGSSPNVLTFSNMSSRMGSIIVFFRFFELSVFYLCFFFESRSLLILLLACALLLFLAATAAAAAPRLVLLLDCCRAIRAFSCLTCSIYLSNSPSASLGTPPFILMQSYHRSMISSIASSESSFMSMRHLQRMIALS